MKEVGVGTRVVNFLVDTIIIFLLSYVLYKWYTFYVVYWQYKYFPYYMFFWGTIFFYYLIFETILSRSPAKFITMTKVRTAAGKRPAFYHVLIRSLLRITLIDPFFIPLFNRPLHDQLSKTRVVEV